MEKTATTHVDLVVGYTVPKEARKEVLAKLEKLGVFMNAKLITPINYHFHLLGYSEPAKQEQLIQNITLVLNELSAKYPNDVLASLCK